MKYLFVSVPLCLMSLSYGDDITEFETIMVEARNEGLSNTGSQVVSKSTFEKNQINRIQDITKDVSNINAPSDGKFGFSGFNIRGIEDNRVPIVIDGLEQAVGFDTPVNIYIGPNRNYFDTEAFKAVSIDTSNQRLNQYNSLSSSVEFTTKSPEDYLNDENDPFAGNFKIGYDGVNESFYESLTLAAQQGSWSQLIQYTRRDGHEQKNSGRGASDIGGEGSSRTRPDPLDFDSNNFLGKVIYDGANYKLALTGEYYDYNGSLDALSSYGGLLNYSDYITDIENNRLRLSLDQTFYLDSALLDTLYFDINYQESEQQNYTTQMIGSNSFGYAEGFRIKDYAYEESKYQFNLAADKLIESSWGEQNIRYGITYETVDSNNRNETVFASQVSTDKIVPNADEKMWGVTLEDSFYFSNIDLTLTPQLKYRHVTISGDGEGDFSDSGLLPAIRINKGLGDSQRIYTNIFQGMRTPTVADLYFGYEGFNYETLANPDLSSETSMNYEIGYEWKNSQYLFNVLGFYNDYSDFIALDTLGVGANGVEISQNRNIDKAEIYGIELTGSAAIGHLVGLYDQQLSVTGSLTWSEGQNKETSEDLDSIAPLKGVFKLNYTSLDEKMSSFIRLTLVDEQSITDADGKRYHTSGFGLTDIGIQYNPMKDMTINLGVNNVFDKEYHNWLDVRGNEVGSQYYKMRTAPERNVAINLNWKF